METTSVERRVIKRLSVTLTQEEWSERANACAAMVEELAAAESRVDSEKEAAKLRVKNAEQEADILRTRHLILARVVRDRKEDREVECIVRINRAERKYEEVRLDTHEVAASRPATDEEMRAGAAWEIDLKKGRAFLRHPAEPGVVLDSRALTDAERQGKLPVDKGAKKAAAAEDAPAKPAPDPMATPGQVLTHDNLRDEIAKASDRAPLNDLWEKVKRAQADGAITPEQFADLDAVWNARWSQVTGETSGAAASNGNGDDTAPPDEGDDESAKPAAKKRGSKRARA